MQRRAATTAAAKRRTAGSADKRRKTPTRSFTCPDELWHQIERFAEQRHIQSSAATRLLLTEGLQLSRRADELARAREWQIEQAWIEAQAFASGDRRFADRDEITRAFARAQARIRERTTADRVG